MAGNGDVLRELVEAFNRRGYERVASLLAGDCKFIDVATGEKSHGIDEIVAEFKKWEGGFPDMEITTPSIVATDQGAAGEFVGRGTQDGALGEIPPTHKKLDEHFALIAEIEDGKITGFRECYDVMTMMGQLGLVPEPAQASS